MQHSGFGCVLAVCFGVVGAFHSPAQAIADDYEQAPIRYSQSMPNNAVSRLIDRLASGEAQLSYEPEQGYLRSFLAELKIPVSSQTLVFSKTSLQRDRISPRTPRALYFNDDVYVGYCQQGDVLEVSAADRELGAVFYTLDQRNAERSVLVRQGDNCLTCHGSSPTRNVPGHLLRSVFADASGLPLLAAGTYRIEPGTPYENRWGGWYVTGTHGAQSHLGNLIVKTSTVPRPVDNSAGLNCTDLSQALDTAPYLSPHSDLAALMVLTHQVDVHNAITRANFLTRQAMHYQRSLNRELKEPEDHVWESTLSRIKSACEPLVESLLSSDEIPLPAPIRGTSPFAEEFVRQGPRDAQGRSLRQLDLERRLFRHPCSYLIYSDSFLALPAEARDYVQTRLSEILSGRDTTPRFARLSPADRRAIREILAETLPEFPLQLAKPAKPGS